MAVGPASPWGFSCRVRMSLPPPCLLMRFCFAIFTFLVLGVSVPAHADVDDSVTNDMDVEASGTLVVRLEKNRRFGSDHRASRRARPARWTGVRVDGRIVGFTDWDGIWEGVLPVGAYRVRPMGLQNIRNVRMVDIRVQDQRFLLLPHNRPLYQEFILSSPEFVFGLLLGSARR